MVHRKQYSKEYKQRLALELLTKQSSGAKICQREGISYATLKKWSEAFAEGAGEENPEEVALLRQENIELKTAVTDLTLQVQMQKKIQEAISQMRKNGR